MATELAIYKINRINEFKRVYNSNISRLNSNLANNIRNINKSRINSKQKKNKISNLIKL